MRAGWRLQAFGDSTMVNTTPRRRALLLNEYPELTDYARTALRLHPRRGMPTAHHSSVGGPLLWPLDEPWPLCHGKHYGDGPTGPKRVSSWPRSSSSFDTTCRTVC